MNNRGKEIQIMWSSTDKRQNKPMIPIAICSVADDVRKDERKDVCQKVSNNPNARER